MSPPTSLASYFSAASKPMQAALQAAASGQASGQYLPAIAQKPSQLLPQAMSPPGPACVQWVSSASAATPAW